MGIKNLLKELPGGDARTDTIRGFTNLHLLKDGKNKVDLDTGTLIFVCALRHRQTYDQGIYSHAVREFQLQILSLINVHGWDMTLIFDGYRPLEKQFEHARRDKEDGLTITSFFIACCVQVCKRMCIPFIVAATEADVQVGKQRDGAIAVSRDSDLIAYGNRTVVLIDNYAREEFRIVDLDVPLTEDIRGKYPLYPHYLQHGPRIIFLWAAAMGCDITENASGLQGVGRQTLMNSLDSLREGGERASISTMSKQLWEFMSDASKEKYSVLDIDREVTRIEKFFTKTATFYSPDGDIMNVAHDIVSKSCPEQLQHMQGDSHPRRPFAFTRDQLRKLQDLQPHNLLHNSSHDRARITGLSFPAGKTKVSELRVDELRGMIISRGGSLTSKAGTALRKEELQHLVEAFLAMEKQNSKNTVFFNRDKATNGIFDSIDTSHKAKVPDMLRKLCTINSFEDSLKKFFDDVMNLWDNGSFTDDWNTIVMNAPEVTETFIQNAFIHVGMSRTQKSIRDGLSRVMEMDRILFHAIATGEDGSLYVLSKQRASMEKEEKTRKLTDVGERPMAKEYLVMAHILVKPTTDPSHGHSLGVCTHLMRSYCVECKAGGGMCYHRAALLWMQMLHWGEGRPTEKPPTAAFCSWVPGSRSQRSCKTTLPASESVRERLPRTNEEARERMNRGTKRSMWEGVSAKYDVFGGDKKKHALVNSAEYVAPARMTRFFECLRKAQKKKNTSNESDDK